MVIGQFPAQFGKYILLDRINSGGMAEVFRAKVTGAEKFERLVAIKCMLPALLEDEHFIGMFIDEAKLASQLNHANIVQIYELGRLGERLYIAMELVNGRDLRHILRSAKANLTPIPVGFAAYVIAKAAEGLDFAHRKAGVDGSPLNLVHRDVSPQNILVSYDGEVKVVDFGIAKAEARATETQAGVLKGKFAYMAPEQVMGDSIDRRADIFALGSVLYEVITGQRLFTGDNDLAVLEKVRAAKLPDLSAILPEGGEELEHVLIRALARKPDERYSHASEMAEDLEHLLIEDRSIFGHKRAAVFMQALYADEVLRLAEQVKLYAEVTTDSCVDVVGDERPIEEQARFVFDASMQHGRDKSDEVDDDAGDTHYEEEHTPVTARRRTKSGVHQTRPMRRVPVQGGPGTIVQPNPTARRSGSVLRKIRIWLLLSAFTTAILVILVSMKMTPNAKNGGNPFKDVPFLGSKDTLPTIFGNIMNTVTPPPAPAPLPAPGVTPPAAGATDEEPGQDEEDTGKGRGKFGWVLIKGSEHGRVMIDGTFVGTLPLAPRKLSVGRHEIKMTDEAGGGRAKQLPVLVTPRHSRKQPKLIAF